MSANEGENIEDTSTKVTVTRGLKNFCKTSIVYEQLQKEVLQFTAIYQEIPILVSYILYTCAKYDNRNFFCQSIGNGALFEWFFNLLHTGDDITNEKQCIKFNINGVIIKNYKQLRQTHNLPTIIYSPLISRQCKQYAIIYQKLFRTYVEKKIKKWLSSFLASEHPGIRLTETIDNLFRIPSCSIYTNEKLMTTMKDKLGFCGSLHQLHKTEGWFSCLPILFRLQELQVIHCSNSSNVIQIIPMVQPGRVYITIDTLDLYEMCFKLGILRRGDNVFSKTILPRIWHSNFHFAKFTNKYTHTIIPELKSNGVTCEFVMSYLQTNERKAVMLSSSSGAASSSSLKIDKQPPVVGSTFTKQKFKVNWQHTRQIPQTLKFSKHGIPRNYERIIGCDIGSKILFSTLELDGKSKALTWHTYKTSTYYHMSGLHWKFHKLNKLTEKLTKEIKLNNAMTQTEYPHLNNIDQYVTKALSNFNKIFLCYTRRALARCEYQAYITKQDHDIRFIEQLTNGFQKTLFFVGNITDKQADNVLDNFNLIIPDKSIASELNSSRKISHIILQFLKKLQNFCDIVFVDEFRTTKLCNYCMENQILSKLPHRFAFCSKCKITRHRDINAAANILHLGLRQVQGKEKLQQFSRSTK